MATTQRTSPITLTVTEQAAVEVRKFMAEEKVSAETAGLRIAVLPGGCSGFKYSLNIEERPLEDDLVLESAGVRLFVDGFSAQYLNGVRLDYKSNFQESGFAFDNPNASGGRRRGTPPLLPPRPRHPASSVPTPAGRVAALLFFPPPPTPPPPPPPP